MDSTAHTGSLGPAGQDAFHALSGRKRTNYYGPPRMPTRLVDRPRLMGLLYQRAPLTVLRGPAGFGKTTLLSQWTSSLPPDEEVVWLDCSDLSSEGEFWRAMLAALDGSEGHRGADAATVAVALRKRARRVTVVLDGVDEVGDTGLDRELLGLVRREHGLHVVAAIRSIRRLPYGIESDVDTVFVTPQQLAFGCDEVASLLVQLGVDERYAIPLDEELRGWPMITRGVALELRRGGNDGESIEEQTRQAVNRHLAYRIGFVGTGDAPTTELLATVLEPVFTKDVVRIASGGDAPADFIDGLMRNGLVLPSSGSGQDTEYRWPPGVRRALLNEYERSIPADCVAGRRRLAGWRFDKGHYALALQHARAAADWPRAIEVIERYWGRLIEEHHEELDAAFEVIPLAIVRESPIAAAARDVRLHALGHPDDLLLTVKSPFPDSREEVGAFARSDRACWAMNLATSMAIALRVRGMFAEAVRYARVAIWIMEDGTPVRTRELSPYLPSVYLQVGLVLAVGREVADGIEALGHAYELAPGGAAKHVEADAAGKLAMFYALQGELIEADRWLQRHQAADGVSTWMSSRIRLSGRIATALVAIGRLDHEAATAAVRALEEQAIPEQTWQPFLVYALARYDLLWGDRLRAVRRVRRTRNRHAQWLGSASTVAPLLQAAEADLLIALGRGGKARALMNAADDHPALSAVSARYALLTDSAEQSLGEATDALGGGQQSSQQQSELLLTAAAASMRLREPDQAKALLDRAIRTMVSAGSAHPTVMLTRRDREALAGLTPELPAGACTGDFPPQVLPDSIQVPALTRAEQAVLMQLAEGLNAQEIANRTFVSYNTIRTQIRTLYRKLDVRSRDEALTQAREHGLL